MGNKFTLKALAGVIMMMVFGTGTMVSSKMMLETRAVTLTGRPDQTFDKPWFQTLAMFNAMFMCIFWYCLLPKKKTPKAGNTPDESSINQEPLSEEAIKKERLQKRILTAWKYISVVVPSFFDLTATTLMTYGLIPINVSVMQMLRGSMVIFSSLLTVFVLKRKLAGYQWLGVATCCLSMVIVGMASIFQGAYDPDTHKTVFPWTSQLLGCILVVLSQFVQACQIVVEEYILGDGGGLHPLQVVGLEGLWGQILCVVCIPLAYFIPGNDNGHLEDTIDSFVMIGHSSGLGIAVAVYWVSILFLNYGGMVVTSELTAVHRTIFEAVRTACIWVVNIFIFYVITPVYGEAWTVWSWMQLAGFGVLIFSTLVYNKVFKLPGFRYNVPAPAHLDETQNLLPDSKSYQQDLQA